LKEISKAEEVHFKKDIVLHIPKRKGTTTLEIASIHLIVRTWMVGNDIRDRHWV
jgi:hypothetical protein